MEPLECYPHLNFRKRLNSHTYMYIKLTFLFIILIYCNICYYNNSIPTYLDMVKIIYRKFMTNISGMIF